MPARIFESPRKTIKLPKAKQILRHDEYGHSKRGLAVCKRCHNVLFRKEWRHPGSKPVEQSKIGWEKGVRFVHCPACYMALNHLYEGEVMIEKLPAKLSGELIRLVTAYGARATKRDPQDRILKIEKRKEGYRITTTENELAVKLAKKIVQVFKKAELSINYLKEPQEVSRVRIRFR